MSEFSQTMLSWYDHCRRSLPWRGTKDPYRIWLSEIMLQQTRTETVMRYYKKFLDRYPAVRDLADAQQDEVLRLWEGLGYYSRARNLHAAAKTVAYDLNGRFPESASLLRKLPGVGPYAANAIASIAYGEAVPALDGNQARVLSRILAWEVPLKTPFDLEEQALMLIDRTRPGDYNQSLMDLGASVCTPKQPDCTACPVAAFCSACKEGDPESYPRKKPPVVKQEKDLTIVIVRCGSSIAVRRRPASGLLGGMYEFAVLDGHPDADRIPSLLESEGFHITSSPRPLPPSRHVFTHLVWRMNGWLVEADVVPEDFLLMDDLTGTAIPSAIRVYREIARDLLNDLRTED